MDDEVDYDDDVTPEAVEQIRKRVEELYGPFNPDEWKVISGPAW